MCRGATLGQPSYIDPRTGTTYPLSAPRWCGDGKDPDGAPVPLMLTELPGITRSQIDTKARSIWRYRASFPLACDEPISLGEGCTPLVARPFGASGGTVHFKCEWFSPTCSFKDRGASVMLSLLRQQGVTDVLEDSSGNGGAAVACYATAGGLGATIMAPSSTSASPLCARPAATPSPRARAAL